MTRTFSLLAVTVMLALAACVAPRAYGQTYDKTHSTALILAGGGTDLTNTLTLQLASSTNGGTIWTLAPANTNGVFINDGTGAISFSTSLPGGFTLNNETIGGTTSIGGSTSINTTGAITTTSTISGGAVTFSSETVNGNVSLDASPNTNSGTINIGNATGPSVTTINGTLDLSGTVNFTSTPAIPLTTNDLFVGVLGDGAALSSATNSVLVTNGTSNGVPGWSTTLPANLSIPTPSITGSTNIDNSGSGGTVNIGNSSSITNIGGTLNITGTVSYTNSPTLPLAKNDIFIGDATLGTADTAHVTQDVTFQNTSANVAQATVNGSHAATFTATGGVTVDGTTTLGAHVLTSSGPTQLGSGSTTNDWGLSPSNSFFKISAAGAATVNGIAGGVDGRVIVLVNTGSNNITFSSDNTGSGVGNRIHLAGNSGSGTYTMILAPDGFATFIYDSTYTGNSDTGAWRVMSTK